MAEKPNQLIYDIPVDFAGRTVESFLKNQLQLSHRRIRAIKRSNGACLNGTPVFVTQRFKGGEILSLSLDTIEQDIPPEALPISIVYEDPDLIVVNKPAGMVVHPVSHYQTGTLANALVHHWREKKEPASFHPVHRLDRLTSGLVLVAKNPWAHQQLSIQLESKSLHRLYLAFCRGNPEKTGGRIDLAIKNSDIGFKQAIDHTGRPSLTRYRVLQRSETASLLAVRLFTGRMHQIRVHLAHLGLALWGDPLYGMVEPGFPRLALHAVKISFIHPRSRIRLKLTAPLPEEILALVRNLHEGNTPILPPASG